MATWLCISVFQLCFLTISINHLSHLSCSNEYSKYLNKEEIETVLKAFQEHKQYECSPLNQE